MIDISSDNFKEIEKELGGITDAIEIVSADVINVVTKRVRQEVVDEVEGNFYIDKAPIRKGIRIGKASVRNPTATISNNRKRDRFTLVRFDVRENTNSPIEVAQNKNMSSNILKNNFVHNGHIWKRIGRAPEDIRIQRSYSIGGMANSENIFEDMEDRALDMLDVELGKGIERFLQGG